MDLELGEGLEEVQGVVEVLVCLNSKNFICLIYIFFVDDLTNTVKCLLKSSYNSCQNPSMSLSD